MQEPENGFWGGSGTQVKWRVRGQLSSVSSLLIRKCILSLQGVHRECRVLDTYSHSDINLLCLHAAESPAESVCAAGTWWGMPPMPSCGTCFTNHSPDDHNCWDKGMCTLSEVCVQLPKFILGLTFNPFLEVKPFSILKKAPFPTSSTGKTDGATGVHFFLIEFEFVHFCFLHFPHNLKAIVLISFYPFSCLLLQQWLSEKTFKVKRCKSSCLFVPTLALHLLLTLTVDTSKWTPYLRSTEAALPSILNPKSWVRELTVVLSHPSILVLLWRENSSTAVEFPSSWLI